MKRLFDIIASGLGLIALSPVFLILAIWHKSKEWAYEEEFRIVKPTFHGLIEVKPDAVVEVIFGCRCSAADENAIRAAAGTGVYNNLVFRHATMSSSKYQLDII